MTIAKQDEINTSSHKIADIVSGIDDIAFQTNILAVEVARAAVEAARAAVEAARAGDQGRDFAVVAGEVCSLAQRSTRVARAIHGLIGSSVEQIAAGSRLAGQAGVAMTGIVYEIKRMTGIVDEVKRVADLIADVCAATTEPASGIAQVKDAVAQLEQAVQWNEALVEHSAAAAASLRQQAQQLAETARVFQLDPALFGVHGADGAWEAFWTAEAP
ncbi:MAG: hypothetical protein J0H09_08010 [Burkholderiales bacterium]|nr:hypothetical protein [Burkholderiales bacterium]